MPTPKRRTVHVGDGDVTLDVSLNKGESATVEAVLDGKAIHSCPVESGSSPRSVVIGQGAELIGKTLVVRTMLSPGRGTSLSYSVGGGKGSNTIEIEVPGSSASGGSAAQAGAAPEAIFEFE